MDDLREWISDNLRYILLGIFILAVLAVIFLSVRFVSGRLNSGSEEETTVSETQGSEEQNAEEASGSEDNTSQQETEAPQSITLEQGKYPAIDTLVQTYYTALGGHDLIGIQSVVDTLDEETRAGIENDTSVEGYEDVVAYTVDGHEENTYIVYVTYNMHFVDVEGALPGLSQLYVAADEDDRLYIATGELDETTQSYLAQVQESEEVQQLITETNESYSNALAENQTLQDYINGLEGETEENTENSTEDSTEE